MLKLIGPLNSGAAVGANGSATANTDSTHLVSGLLHGVYIKYNDSPPAGTTDVSITTKAATSNAPAQTLLAIANAATDGWFYPRVQVHLNTTGAALTLDGTRIAFDRLPVNDLVNVKIDQADANDNIDVWLLLEC